MSSFKVHVNSLTGQVKFARGKPGKVTLGNVITQLDSTNLAKTGNRVKKTLGDSPLRLESGPMVAAGKCIANTNDNKSSSDLNKMRLSLKKQLQKQRKVRKPSAARRVAMPEIEVSYCGSSSSNRDESEFSSFDGVSPLQSRVSSAVSHQRFQEKYADNNIEVPAARPGSRTSIRNMQLDSNYKQAKEADEACYKQQTNIYSRHLQSTMSDGSDVSSLCHVDDGKERKNSASSGTSRISVVSMVSQQGGPKSVLRKRRTSETESEGGKNIGERSTNAGEKSETKKPQSEREFVETLSDPTLKSSMETIMQKRLNSVRFVKLKTGGIQVLNQDDAFSIILEEGSKNSEAEDHEREREKIANSETASVETSASRTTNRRTQSAGVERKQVSSVNDIYYNSASRPSSQYTSRSVKASSRPVSSARSYMSSRSGWTTRSHSQSARREVPKTEETRIILPMSAKKYRPTLVTDKRRVKSAYANPRNANEGGRLMDKDAAVREFLMMYAKVKSDGNQQRDFLKEYEEMRTVRMMSETPEFVVKSAIGQFLTCAFPSGKASQDLMVGSPDHKYEDLQRMKLLKIKTCMQQLASLA